MKIPRRSDALQNYQRKHQGFAVRAATISLNINALRKRYTRNMREPQSAPSSPPCLTIYHDGSCPLCQREIGLISKLDAAKVVAFADVSGLANIDVAPGLSAENAMRRFHVRRADGTVLSGPAAFIEMWSLAPRLRFLKRLQSRPRTLAVLDYVYSGFLVVRPVLSRALGQYDRWRGKSPTPINERFPDRGA